MFKIIYFFRKYFNLLSGKYENPILYLLDNKIKQEHVLLYGTVDDYYYTFVEKIKLVSIKNFTEEYRTYKVILLLREAYKSINFYNMSHTHNSFYGNCDVLRFDYGGVTFKFEGDILYIDLVRVDVCSGIRYEFTKLYNELSFNYKKDRKERYRWWRETYKSKPKSNTNVNVNHPKWSTYMKLIEGMRARKTQLAGMSKNDENYQILKNEHNSALRLAKKMKSKYNF